MTYNITVLGSGAWGTALAKHAKAQGHSVSLWCRRREVANAINNANENTEHLSGIDLAGINATADISSTASSDMVLVATPSQHMRSVLSTVKVADNTPLILCCKGIENESLDLMHMVAKKCVKNANVVVLSGPTFAIEVAKHLPTTITLAGNNTDMVFNALSSPNFRIYKTDDIIGTEIGGAVKNIMAIACGIANGKKMGDNAKASIITRAMAEISRLNNVLGGENATLMLPCGIGDLILTCSSIQSRNMSFGTALGSGQKMEEILASRNSITEGIKNTQSVYDLSQKVSVEMPIVNTIYDILYNNKDINDAISTLLNRSQK